MSSLSDHMSSLSDHMIIKIQDDPQISTKIPMKYDNFRHTHYLLAQTPLTLAFDSREIPCKISLHVS